MTAWSWIFIANITLGIFLVSLFVSVRKENALASRFLMALLILMLMVSMVYLAIRTSFRDTLPQVYGMSVGLMFLYGPLFYFYSRSVTDRRFHWKKKYCVHFV